MMNSNLESDEILTLAETCDYLQMSKSVIRRLIDQKKIPAHRIGRDWRFITVELNEWVRTAGESIVVVRKENGLGYIDQNVDQINKNPKKTKKKRKSSFGQSHQYNNSYSKNEITRNISQYNRAIALNLLATLTIDEWYLILDQHFGRCHYCGKKSDKLHQEHKIPLSKGGGYTAQNIVPSCQSCNSAKNVNDYKKFVKDSNDRLQLDMFDD